ncbi:MAG TPA: hypothetical protein VFK13_13170 [Gemmatimonadaceae bacterium]|nr:hypothetical protein [Gemmatimonadaceae bacterium]
MKTTLTYIRTTFGFLAGAAVLATACAVVIAIAVSHSDAPHSSPTRADLWFGFVVLAVLTLGFASAAWRSGRSAVALLPTRIAVITGAAAVALQMIVMMLVGESLGYTAIAVIAFPIGVLATAVALRSRRANVLPASALPQ